MQERETLQEVLSAYFRDESLWRQRQWERFALGVDKRYRTATTWLAELAAFVRRLPDDDPGIETLTAFGWPAECFRHGTGFEGSCAVKRVGFDGTRTKPLIRQPEKHDLERAWAAWVAAAERDAREIERMLEILVALIEDTPRSRLQAALGRFARRSDDAWSA